MNQRQTRQCKGCGGTQTFFSGISKKSGNPYEVWKCPDCQQTDWNPTPRQSFQPKFVKQGNQIKVDEKPDWDTIRAEKEAGMEWLNAKNNATLLTMKELELGNLKDIETAQTFFQSWLRYIYSLKQPKNDDTRNLA